MERKKNMTNAEYAKKKSFVEACQFAGVKPTTRQASKWRRQTGKAWQLRQAYKSE